MAKFLRIRHNYRVQVQGLFCGVEWTVFRDGKPVASGESESVDVALERAKGAVEPMIRQDKQEGRRHA